MKEAYDICERLRGDIALQLTVDMFLSLVYLIKRQLVLHLNQDNILTERIMGIKNADL